MVGTIFVVLAFVLVFYIVRIVPQQSAYVVERLGKYDRTLTAGLHIILPFIDRVSYKHSLKELVLDVPEQLCITRDNVQIHVDGVLFMRVMDASRASYGVSNYQWAVSQLAQTTLRSEFGKLDLDRTFEERESINGQVVLALDKATESWGVKVLRYEIKSITPPKDVIEAMEKQMRAEREKRAKILESEGDRDSKINRADGVKQETIKASEAQRQKQINEAEGEASAILAIATATANGLRQVASALAADGGREAARLRVAENWVNNFGELARTTNSMIVPASVSDMSAMLATAFGVFEQSKTKQ
ncbi:MAG: paraslipin [Deltaproteobacteria bacterium]|nr:paraslipin [Deltaproteobacteria bacterium]